MVIKEMDPDNLVTLNISTENLILEGIRRCRSWSQVQRGIGDIGHGVRAAPATPTCSTSWS